MKKIVIAIDSFKGSLSTYQAGMAVKEAFLKLYPDSEAYISPVADGGEGTVDAIVSALKGKMVKTIVSDPLGRKIEASYGLIPNTDTAVIEMSAAAGITLINENERNPMNTTTFGVGEMILDAINKGCRRFLIGIGGSATNDGGVGMLSALGFAFLDKNGKEIESGAKGLQYLDSISLRNVIPSLQECRFKVACDVENPLCGEKGCSAVYGPQKGATAEDIVKMDAWLSRYADIAKTVSSTADKNYKGAGAAGGLGFAFLSFTNAVLEPGIDIILAKTRLEDYIKDADLVVTGEGRLDSQTAMGKAPVGVAKLAKKYGKKVIAFSGCVTKDAEILNNYGIDAFFPILRGVVTLEEALKKENAYENLVATATQVFRLIIK